MTKNLVNKPLTEKQKKYAKIFVDAKFGSRHLTNTEIAIQAGYAPESAYQRAHELQNPHICPHVVKYIGELQEEFRKKNNIDPDKHMARLNHLGTLAEKNKMYGVARDCEHLRGKVAGYYIDRQIIKQKKSIEDLSEDELNERMQKILDDNQHLLTRKK